MVFVMHHESHAAIRRSSPPLNGYAAAYLVLSVGIGMELPGEVTLLERLAREKYEYRDGLEDADRAWSTGGLDVHKLRDLVARLLNQQLADAGYVW